MSAPGIQLNSEPHLPAVHPTVRQYLQGIKEAVMSDNLPAAQQAFAQLKKAVPSPSQGSSGQNNDLATRISQGLDAVGKALQAGDLTGARQAVGELRQNFQSASNGQVGQSSGSDISTEDGGGSDSGPSLNITA